MDADRPAQPVDPADPTVVQRRPTAPEGAGSGEPSGQEGPAGQEPDAQQPPEPARPAPGTSEPTRPQPVQPAPGPSGATEVLRRATAPGGATEVFRAPKPAPPAAPPLSPPPGPAPQAPRPGGNAVAGQRADARYAAPQQQPQQPGPGYGAAAQPTAPYGGQYGPPPGAYGQHPTPTFDPGPGMPPSGPAGAPAGAPPPRKRGTLIALIAAGVVLLAAVGVGGWFLLRPRYVDPEIAKAEVIRVTQQTDELAATDVRCPTDAEQERGATFTCTAMVVEKQITYTVTQDDDEGRALSVRYDRPVLDPVEVQQEIVQSTRTELGVEPTDVRCPDDVHYDRSATFTCTATLQNQPLSYTVTQTDGLGGVSLAHGRVLKNAEIAQKIADELTKQVGAPIVVQCGPVGQTVLVNEPGTPIDCRASATANPSKVVPIPVLVDRSGTVYPAT